MAQYKAIIEGQRGPISRLGSKKSGLLAVANGWNIGIKVYLTYNEKLQRDEAEVILTGGSNGGNVRTIGRFGLTNSDEPIEIGGK